MSKVKEWPVMQALWEIKRLSDGSAEVRTVPEVGDPPAGTLVAHYPLAAVADVVVAAHNKALADAKEYSTMIRVAYGNHDEAALVQRVLPTPRMRGQVLFDTARANK